MKEFNDDLLDEGLQGVMGKDRCQNLCDEKKPAGKARNKKVVDAKWEPAPHEPTQMERLKAAAKDTMLYAALSLLFFYFQQSGQMAMSASMPCILTCVALAGYGVGKNIAGGR